MVETSDQIERHIQRTRDELNENVNELEVRVKTALDWRAQMEQRPGTLLALAFGGGLLVSALIPSSRASQRSSGSGWTSSSNGNSRRNKSWDAVKGALVGIATTRLTEFVETLIPGFQQELTKAQHAAGVGRRRLAQGSSGPRGVVRWNQGTQGGTMKMRILSSTALALGVLCLFRGRTTCAGSHCSGTRDLVHVR